MEQENKKPNIEETLYKINLTLMNIKNCLEEMNENYKKQIK